MIFLEADLSQIESRVVFLLTGDPEMARLACLPSYEYDGHTENIMTVGLVKDAKTLAAIKAADPAEFKRMRHVGKITSHGAQRDMRGAKLSGTILKELEVLVSAEKCDEYLQNYHNKYPLIRNGYFRETRKLVMRDRMLVNSWGRQMDFRWDRLDDELFRQAYNFVPQSENADLMNQRGVKPAAAWCRGESGASLNVQVHDSMLFSVTPANAYSLARFVEKQLSQPLLIGGTVFRPFVEFKLGLNWAADEKAGEGFEFKKLPSREEFFAKADWLDRNRIGKK